MIMLKNKENFGWFFVVYFISIQTLFKDDLKFYLGLIGIILSVICLLFVFLKLDKSVKKNTLAPMFIVLLLMLLFYMYVENKFKI